MGNSVKIVGNIPDIDSWESAALQQRSASGGVLPVGTGHNVFLQRPLEAARALFFRTCIALSNVVGRNFCRRVVMFLLCASCLALASAQPVFAAAAGAAAPKISIQDKITKEHLAFVVRQTKII